MGCPVKHPKPGPRVRALEVLCHAYWPQQAVLPRGRFQLQYLLIGSEGSGHTLLLKCQKSSYVEFLVFGAARGRGAGVGWGTGPGREVMLGVYPLLGFSEDSVQRAQLALLQNCDPDRGFLV